MRALAAQGIRPGLAAVLVGPCACFRNLRRAARCKTCAELGLYSDLITPPRHRHDRRDAGPGHSLNDRDDIDGILIQLPLPKQVDTKALLDAVSSCQGCRRLSSRKCGQTAGGPPGAGSLHPRRHHRNLKRSNLPISGQHAVIVGRSDIVGKPVAMLLLHENATVTICHSKTRDLGAITREADILVAAIGRPGFITPEMVKPGATIIDVGINRLTTLEEFDRFFAGDAKREVDICEARIDDCGRRPSQGLRTRRSLHTGARRRRPAHHRHADVQHRARRQNAAGDCSPMLRVGLTGGLGSGKSTVARCCANWARRSSSPTSSAAR